MATASLVAIGCVMLRKCHLNTCSVGIATQDPELRERFPGTPEHVVALLHLRRRGGARAAGAARGAHARRDGRPRRPAPPARRTSTHWKARRLDLRPLLAPPRAPADAPRRCVDGAAQGRLATTSTTSLLQRARGTLRRRAAEPARARRSRNAHRAVGAMLSGEIARRARRARAARRHASASGCTARRARASARSSPRGVTLELEGDANDYVGKGLSGGRVIVYPPAGGALRARGERDRRQHRALRRHRRASCSPARARRRALRGAQQRRLAVVEGVGDHGCEYMTGGVVVVLGATGRNFAAGMSGGIAYVFDRERAFRERCNLEMVELESLVDESDIWLVLRADRGPRPLHREPAGAPGARQLGAPGPAVREGDADRLQARAPGAARGTASDGCSSSGRGSRSVEG